MEDGAARLARPPTTPHPFRLLGHPYKRKVRDTPPGPANLI